MTYRNTFQVQTIQNDVEYAFQNNIQTSTYNSIYLKQMILSLSFYSIRTGFNSKLRVIDASNNIHDIMLSEGSYTHLTLQSELQNQLNNTIGTQTFTVVFNPSRDTYTMTSNSNFQLDFLNSDPSTYRLIGFDKTVTLASTSHESTKSPRLRDNFIKLLLNINDANIRSINDSYIFPIVGSFKDNLIYYDNEFGIQVFEMISPTQINKIHVQIKDENDNLINLRNGFLYLFFEMVG